MATAGVIADTAEPGRGEGLLAGAGVAVRRNDQVGAIGDFLRSNQFGISLYRDLDARGACRGRKPVVGVATTTRAISTPCCRSILKVVTPKWRERPG